MINTTTNRAQLTSNLFENPGHLFALYVSASMELYTKIEY